jgi:hypothetical protein
MENRGEIPATTVKHWEATTPKNKKLPEHVKAALDKLAEPPPPKGVSVDAWDKVLSKQLKHSKDPDSDFPASQLQRGVEVEREHSEALPVRKAIAKAHIAEFPSYYTGLDEMETKLKKKEQAQEKKTAAYLHGATVALQKLGSVLPAALLGAGIGAIADGDNRWHGALRGAGTGAGIRAGAGLGIRLGGYGSNALMRRSVGNAQWNKLLATPRTQQSAAVREILQGLSPHARKAALISTLPIFAGLGAGGVAGGYLGNNLANSVIAPTEPIWRR